MLSAASILVVLEISIVIKTIICVAGWIIPAARIELILLTFPVWIAEIVVIVWITAEFLSRVKVTVIRLSIEIVADALRKFIQIKIIVEISICILIILLETIVSK